MYLSEKARLIFEFTKMFTIFILFKIKLINMNIDVTHIFCYSSAETKPKIF